MPSFMKYDGVQGGESSSGHATRSELQSNSPGGSSATHGAHGSGGGGGSGKASMQDFHLSLQMAGPDAPPVHELVVTKATDGAAPGGVLVAAADLEGDAALAAREGGYEGQIQVLSWSWGATQTGSMGPADGAGEEASREAAAAIKTFLCPSNPRGDGGDSFVELSADAAASAHSGGVNVCLGDGSVRFVSDSADLVLM